MFNKLAIVGLALFGTSVFAPAQDVRLHLGRSGVHASVGLGGHDGPRLHVGYGSRSRIDRQRYRGGHYRTVTRRVWVPGCARQVWVPPVYGSRLDACGLWVRYVIRPGYYRTVHEPGHWEVRTERVRVPGRYRRR